MALGTIASVMVWSFVGMGIGNLLYAYLTKQPYASVWRDAYQQGIALLIVFGALALEQGWR